MLECNMIEITKGWLSVGRIALYKPYYVFIIKMDRNRWYDQYMKLQLKLNMLVSRSIDCTAHQIIV